MAENIDYTQSIDFKLPPEELLCPRSGRQLEFVCTKKDSKLCVDRLCCSKCVITEYSDYFQWMTNLEDFFTPNSQVLVSDAKSSSWSEIETFLDSREENTSKFDQRVENEASTIRESVNKLRMAIAEEFKKLEESVQGERDIHFGKFSENYEELEKSANPVKDVDEELIVSDLEQLQAFLEDKIKAESKKEEFQPHRVLENLTEILNAMSVVQFNDKKAATILETAKKLLAFGIVIDRFNFSKKKQTNHEFKANLEGLSAKFTISTASKKITKMALINEDTQIAICSDDETITIWDRATSQLIQTLTGHNEHTLTVIQLRDGSLASGGSDNKVKIWNIAKGTCEQELIGHTGHVSALIELPQLGLLSGSKDKSLRWWDLKNKEKPAKATLLDSKQNRIFAMVLVSHDELAVSSENNINIVAIDDFVIRKNLTGHTGPVRDLIVVEKSPGNLLLSASEDKSVRLWDLDKSTIIRSYAGHQGAINKILMINSNCFVSGGEDSELKFWELEDGKNTHTIVAHSPGVTDIALVKDFIVTCGTDKTIKFWSE